MALRQLATAHCCVWVVALAIGCGDSKLEVQFAKLQHPSGARASANPRLVELLDSIGEQGGLPAQLDSPLGSEWQNVAAGLADAYSAKTHAALAPVLQRVLAPESNAAERRQLLHRHAALLDETRRVVDRPDCQWDVGHRWGFFARMRYLDDARLASRLLLAAALAATAPDEAPAALEHVQRSLRLADSLSTVGRIEARVLAASIREETLSAFRRLALEGLWDGGAAEVVYGRLRDSLADWPSDTRMLIGERATVVHAYEAIRIGWLDRLVSPEERDRLEKENQLVELNSASDERIDADEVVYLEVLSGLIDAADTPYHARTDAVSEAFRVADQAEPLFAQRLFLTDLEEATRIAAADRARCEVWTIALSAAAGLRTPPFRVCPLNGEPYQIEIKQGYVRVSAGAGGPGDLTLPKFTL
ncbi:hypothetical protein [Botrimarina sp.]|uniref:hypothetical protein n=1 Tax=Botrimarina sp. TaxID=2795802 RepID=UPI0032EFED67